MRLGLGSGWHRVQGGCTWPGSWGHDAGPARTGNRAARVGHALLLASHLDRQHPVPHLQAGVWGF